VPAPGEIGDKRVNEPFNVVIVGGGTSGWMTAAYLRKALDRDVTITVVESAAVGRIGVGEATFSTIRLFFEFLGLDETDWMPDCQATYKLAIKFVDWNAERRHFYHPFQRFENVRGHSVAEWWLKLLSADRAFDYSCFVVPDLCDAKRSPRFHDGRTFCEAYEAQSRLEATRGARMLQHLQMQYPYAYHFDAQLMADYLAGYAQRRGVTRVIDDVVDARRLENGHIDAIVTRAHGDIRADLFVDCSGFRGLLINQALGEPFIPFASSLLCDRAIALQIPSDSATEGIEPYTTATALTCGWAWNIPLRSRNSKAISAGEPGASSNASGSGSNFAAWTPCSSERLRWRSCAHRRTCRPGATRRSVVWSGALPAEGEGASGSKGTPSRYTTRFHASPSSATCT